MTKLLTELSGAVISLRDVYAAKQQVLADMKATWDAEHGPFLRALREIQEQLIAAETNLREEALSIYATTGDKQVAPGIVIREVTHLRYDDAAALKWAKAHDVALALDKRLFEKVVKAVPPDFVEIIVEPQATLAKHLEVVQ